MTPTYKRKLALALVLTRHFGRVIKRDPPYWCVECRRQTPDAVPQAWRMESNFSESLVFRYIRHTHRGCIRCYACTEALEKGTSAETLKRFRYTWHLRPGGPPYTRIWEVPQPND